MMSMRRAMGSKLAVLLAVFLAAAISLRSLGAERARPNILLILADDLGWGDLGCYGGEIQTPNIDALAADGLRFTQFYNSARCSPSRASLITGLYPHQVGMPNLGGHLNDQSVTIPQVLGPAGYRCFMSGKWHMGRPGPVAHGFEEFYGFIDAYSVNCWDPRALVRLPAGRPMRTYPQGTYYAPDAITDYALDFLQTGRQSPDKPWFLYLAYNTPHFPLQAPEKDIEKYEALYAQGWDRIREQRLARQKQLGVVPKDLQLTPRSLIPANWANRQTGWADKRNPAWDSLPADRRADLARRMAVFAAMVDHMDQGIGRVIADLKQHGEFENTVIFFLSDNGACAEWDPYGFDGSSGPHNTLHTGADLKKVGGPGSYISYGSGWANASNTPWRLYKHYGHEGGVSTPFIVHWPAGMQRRNEIDNRPLYIADVMPTCADLARAQYPKEYEGHAILPCEGLSLLPAMQNRAPEPRTIFFEHEGNRSVREGDWKLVALQGHPWELYNMSDDRTEMHDLASSEPQRVLRMSSAWDQWADRCNVPQPMEPDVASPQIANKALTITCDVTTQAKEGVVLAQGGDQQGYALHLHEGRLVFSVRINRKVTSITASETPSGKFSVKAMLKRDGAMELAIDGRVVAQGKAPGLIPVQPIDALTIRRDARSAVGDYQPPLPLRGQVKNVKVVTD